MRRSIIFFITAPLLVPVTAMSTSTEIGSSTILRMEQRAVTGQPKLTLIPATEFLSIDSTGLVDGNLSLHLAGWGRADMADNSYSNGTIDGSFTYGYLRYRFVQANADLRVGRFFLREGIINEHVDGATARTDLPFGFYLSAFGGAPVHTKHLYGETSDGKGSSIFGGRIAYRYQGMLELGMSGVSEGSAPTLSTHTNYNHRLAGGDIWFSPIRYIEILGHTSYNLETSKIAEHTYLFNVKPAKHLMVTGEFNEHRELSYLGATWARFPGSTIDPNERSRSVGGNASYEITQAVEIAADYKHYKRDIGTADRVGGDIRFKFLNNALNGGLGFHNLRAGENFAIGTNNSGSYNEFRAYLMYDSRKYFIAFDNIGYFFKEKVDGEKSALETKLSLGYYLAPALVLSGDISYGRNPEYRNETKGLIRLTYNATFDTKGGKK